MIFVCTNQEKLKFASYYEEIFIKHLLCAIQFGIWAIHGGEFDLLQF